jgi:chromosome partitioning protein
MPRKHETTKPRFLAVAHLKGGSGATTVAVNLAAGLAARRRVLLVDLDPIAAATFHLSAEAHGLTIADALDGRTDLARVLAPTALERLALAPASPQLTAWDRKPERFPVELARVLASVPEGFDFVVLDLPPSAGAIVRGVLAVLPGGEVLAPVQTRALDLVGFSDLVRLLDELHEQNPALHLAGVVPVRVNRGALSRDVLEALTHQHGRRVLPGIRESTAVARAPVKRMPLALAAPHAPALEDFTALTRAILNLEA